MNSLPLVRRLFAGLLFALAAFAPWTLRAQFVSHQAARADLDTLQRILEKNAAYLALNRYDYRAHLDSLRRVMPDSLAAYDFRFDVHALIGRLQDSHSTVDLPGTQLPDVRELPFATGVHAGKVVALGNTDSGLLAANYPYLAAINGISIEKLLQISGAGFRGHSPQRFLWRAAMELTRIPFILRRAGALRGDTLFVTLSSGAGRDTSLRLRFAARQPARPRITRATSMLADSIAYLRISTMWVKGDPGADLYLSMMRAAMESSDFQTSRGLIIDLRGNTGGSRDVLEYIAAYFITAPLPYNASYPVGDTVGLGERSIFHPGDPAVDTTTRRIAGEFAKRFRASWRPSIVPVLDQIYVAVLQDRPTPYEYTKPVVVLMDESCFSATDIFLGAMAELPKITLLGTTSAGGSGRSRNYVLPNSRVRVTLSTMASFRPNGSLYDGRGIEPTVRVERSLSDAAGRTDSQLQAAIERILHSSGGPSGR